MSPPRPKVVIVGAGFGGLAAAQALRKAQVDVTIIDKRNHHLFQPLLYQVATAALSPADIAAPIRGILAGNRNTRVLLDRVEGVDTGRKEVRLASGAAAPYDWLILATGARHSYFGHPEWETIAPGLKSIDDAIVIRHRFLDPDASAEVIAQKLAQTHQLLSIRSVQRVIADYGLQKKTLRA